MIITPSVQTSSATRRELEQKQVQTIHFHDQPSPGERSHAGQQFFLDLVEKMVGALLSNVRVVQERDEHVGHDPLDGPEHVFTLRGVHHAAHDLFLECLFAQCPPWKSAKVN